MFLIGLIENLRAWNVTEGVIFWSIGVLTAVPGFYFTYKICKAFRCTSEQERRAILNDIPDF